MNLGHNLTLKQTQTLSMTPELQQAIMLLQLSSLELNEYIRDEIEKNPLLEIEKSKDDINEDLEKAGENADDIDWKEYIEKYDDISYKPQVDRNKEEIGNENFVIYTQSLKEYLLEQIGLLELEKEIRSVSEYIVQNLDSNGYLKMEIEEISSLLKIEIDLVKTSLDIVQDLDPKGVGASNLKECLLLQLDNEYKDSIVGQIIDKHLENLGFNRLKHIAKDLNININKIQEAIDFIKTLDPKPGRAFSDENLENIRYITPDAYIEWIDGEYKVSVSESTGPRLNINNFYKNLISKSSDETAKAFLTDRLNSATWIIKSIEQRRNTIRRVVEAILEHQIDFFVDGEKALKPLTLKMIAEDIDMHESSISRTTNGKYVQTPKGVFELKYFFTAGLNTTKGEVSSTSIKSMIEDIIKSESLKKPYSDQKIADILKEKGCTISRRTVAKYRDELAIPSSTMRKRFD